MAMIKRLNNNIKKLFGYNSKQVDNNQHDYDFPVLVQLLSKLPEDILIEILVRLPADVVVLLRPIWRNLTSSPLFVDLHLSRRADSIHVVQSVYRDGYNRKAQLSTVDCTRKNKCMDLVYDRITGETSCTIWGSCGGLLAFWSIWKRGSICIVNPITGENRDISTPSLNGYLCGFFFDRFQGRYKLLYVDLSKSKVNSVYFMFDLSESVWRKLDMTKSCLDSRPSRGYPGVIVGDALHWIKNPGYPSPCSKMVVVFKIETQELYSLPHPPVQRGGNNGGNLISATTRCEYTHESHMNLIAKDGQLCFCHTIVEERAVDLWILEDYNNWGSWVKKFKVNLVSIHKIFRRMTSSSMYIFLRGLRIGSPQNASNEILVTCIYGSWKGLYGYHLETDRSRQLVTPGSKKIKMVDYVMLPYTKTMLSPMFKASRV